LKLSGDALAKIFLGEINNWNDPAIKALNPSLTLPAKTITVVTRADGSGTTWVFTTYLSAVSESFKTKVGADKAVKWPGANTVSGKGSEGLTGMVKQVEGSIGYVESAYATQNKLTHTLVQNKDGAFPEPGTASYQAAAASADWATAPGMYVVLVNEPGKESWPITAASFILMQKKQTDGAHAAEVLKFFNWCAEKGDAAAASLDYVPLPDNVVKLVIESWGKNITDTNGKAIWTGK
jgi:phosphate transport system substrate-binding protein